MRSATDPSRLPAPTAAVATWPGAVTATRRPAPADLPGSIAKNAPPGVPDGVRPVVCSALTCVTSADASAS